MGRPPALTLTASLAGAALGLWGCQLGVHYLRLHLRLRALLSEYTAAMIPGKRQRQLLKQEFIAQMVDGLAAEVPAEGRKLLMLPSYVTQIPDGMEKGDCYAIDVGGTNFRVMYVHLSDLRSGIDKMDVHEVSLPTEIMASDCNTLYDFFATTLTDFINSHQGSSHKATGRLPVVGFCFSFPMKQTSLSSGILVDWTKGFTATGCIGSDPVELLSKALQRSGCPCRVTALINDTVGVLAAHRYRDPDTVIGMIVGTGTNACYVEHTAAVTKWNAPPWSPSYQGEEHQTVINIEWGAFDSPHLPKCTEDHDVDAATLHAGKYLYEKLVSGMFMGEIARRIILRLASEGCLFGVNKPSPSNTTGDGLKRAGSRFSFTLKKPPPGFGHAAMLKSASSGSNGPGVVPKALREPGSFTTAFLAAIVDDSADPKLQRTAVVLAGALRLETVPMKVRKAVREVCLLIARRSATMVAIAIEAILQQTGWFAHPKRVVVAVDGGVYTKFTSYGGLLQEALHNILGDEKAKELGHLIQLDLCHDGSCLGAAVLAAAAAQGTLDETLST